MAERLALLGTLARKVGAAKYITLCIWITLAALGGIFAPKVIDVTTVAVAPPHGSPSAEANEAFLHYFPNVGMSVDFALLIKADFMFLNSDSVVSLIPVGDFTRALYAKLSVMLGEELIGFASYFTLMDAGVPLSIAKKQFVSPNGEATLVTWQIRGDPTKSPARQQATRAQDLIAELRMEFLGADSGLECLLSGLPLTINAAVIRGQIIMETMDAISLPVAVVVCGAVVRSVRFMVVPLVLLGVSLSISFAFLYAMSYFTVIESSTPPLMMSLLIAMSFDYSLFICTRFREEVGVRLASAREHFLAQDDCSVSLVDKIMDAIEATFSTAGFTVLLSGMTLTASFCILMFCPVDLVFSMGSGCAFALLVTNLAALTVPPAMFAAFPHFFAQGCGDDTSNRCQKCSFRTWSSISKVTTRWPWNLVVILIMAGGTLLIASHALWSPGLLITTSLKFNIPYQSELAEATDDIAAVFGKGKLLPYKLLMAPRNNAGAILSADGVGWNKCIFIIETLVNNPNLYQTSSDSFNFACYADGAPLHWDYVKPCLGSNGWLKILWHNGRLERLSGKCKLILQTIGHFIDGGEVATYGYISLQMDPLNPEGQKWVQEMRRSMKELSDNTDVDLYLIGEPQESWDMIAQLYSWFPYMVANSLVVAFCLLGIAFRSVVLPLRSCVSILLTIGFVFGLAVACYQEGCFDWIGVHGISSDAGGIHFIVPFLAFSVVMGICLDYEIFLLSRTVEVCEQTCNTRKAIQQSLVATGSIITSAGIIMVIAFGGLMLSSMLALNQLGFFLAFAAFYDTFVVRTIISPATMDLLGDWHWWPSPLFRKTRAAKSVQASAPHA